MPELIIKAFYGSKFFIALKRDDFEEPKYLIYPSFPQFGFTREEVNNLLADLEELVHTLDLGLK